MGTADDENSRTIPILERDDRHLVASPTALIGGIPNHEVAGALARGIDIEGDGNGCRHAATICSAEVGGKAQGLSLCKERIMFGHYAFLLVALPAPAFE